MALEEVRKYIERRYERWLDYSKYHCGSQWMAGEEGDLLNEVMISLLEKPEEKLLELYNKKHKQYRELDYFVLRMIKMNATSDTAPYRHKNKPAPIDRNVDYSSLEIEDIEDDQYDHSGEILEKTRLIREAIEDIEEQSDPLDVEAFFFKYFDGEKSTAWRECNAKKFYERYCRVANKVKVYIKNIETRRLKIKSIWYNFAV